MVAAHCWAARAKNCDVILVHISLNNSQPDSMGVLAIINQPITLPELSANCQAFGGYCTFPHHRF
jgi:hypothetical protein